MTKKYYDIDAYRTEFDATVLVCEPHKKGFSVVLDGTLFFPEEGGQKADGGTLNGIPVSDVQLKGNEIFHITEKPFSVGERIHGVIHFAERYHKMQNHSGEHVVSGIVHKLYGFDNVGFHLGSEDVTLDFSGELTREDLDRVEELANDVIYQNIPITAEYPPDEVLKTLSYRAKLDLRTNLRIVTIGDVDACACCAPHVRTTGEIGMIKLLDFIRYKGGVRIHMQCGKAALMDYRQKYRSVAQCSALMSVKQCEIAQGVSALLKANEAIALELRSIRRRLAEEMANEIPSVSSAVCLFKNELDMEFWRDVAMLVAKRQMGTAFILMPKQDGSFSYVACSETVNLKNTVVSLNKALNGRGGGKEGMIQGSLAATREEIEDYIKNNF